MYDAATVLLREYWRATGWNDQSSYLNLSKASDGVFASAVTDEYKFFLTLPHLAV
jgi:hypothetical protein